MRVVKNNQKQFLSSLSVNSSSNFQSEKKFLKPLALFTQRSYKIRSDPRIESILKRHQTFLKLKPLSPISISSNIANISMDYERKNYDKPLKDLRILSDSATYKKTLCSNNSSFHCDYHTNVRPLRPCIDCFFKNYYGDDYSDSNLAHILRNFKNYPFPNFNKPEFELTINNTEIPLFDTELVNNHFKSIKSCKTHIFSPPHEPCDDCMQLN